MDRGAYRSRKSYAQVSWDMVAAVGGDIALAVIFDWITFKADPEYDGITDDDGHVWYAASVNALASTMNVTEKTVRRALATLVDLGHLAVEQLHIGGPYDRTKAYRPVWDDERAAAKSDGDEAADASDVEDEEPRNDAFAPEGKSICPEGPMTFAPEGESHLPSGANVPVTNHLLTELTDIPPTPAALIAFDAVAQEPSIGDLFEAFWSVYPRRVARAAAEKAFAKAVALVQKREHTTTATAAAAITEAARSWRTVWQAEGRESHVMPHASSWLNGERWTDELPQQPAPGAAPPGRRLTNAEQNLARYLGRRQGVTDELRPDRTALDHGVSDRQPDRLGHAHHRMV